MDGAMKGLNDMEFNIGDVVRIDSGYVSKRFVGTIGIVRDIKTSIASYYTTCVIEVSELTVRNPLVLTDGTWINGIRVLDKDLVLLDYTTDEEDELLAKIRSQRVNNERNTWEVRIRPFDEDKDSASAELYVNGRLETTEYVNRYYKDKYNAGIACIEICKKLFGVKDIEESEEKISMPKYYTGKVICTGDTKYFTKGKVYKVENGTIYSDGGKEFIKFESLEQLNAFRLFVNANFIELVE